MNEPAERPLRQDEKRNRDQFALDADRFNTSTLMNASGALDIVVAACSPRRGHRIVDAACGPGIVAEQLALHGATVVGVDISPDMIRLARERCRTPRTEFCEGSMYGLPVETASADVVVSRYALHHAADPGAAIAEMIRVLKPSGRLVVADFQANADPLVADAYDQAERLRDPSHVRNLTSDEQRSFPESLGWAVVDVTHYRLTATVTAALAGSHGVDHDGFAAAFSGSLESHRLGVQARRRPDGEIEFEYPIVVHTFERGASS